LAFPSSSLSIDDRLEMLLDARERARRTQLRPEDLPADSMHFSHFQVHRLLRRNRINEQVEQVRVQVASAHCG
jgi:hypothetical protein